MRRTREMILVSGLALLLTVAAACGGDEAEVAQPGNGTVAVAPTSAPVAPAAVPGTVTTVPARSAGISGAPVAVGAAGFVDYGLGASRAFGAQATQPSGIVVSGTGRVVTEPDRAVITLGVEARAATVAEARGAAARAMTAIGTALRAQGIADRDIQTRFFSISPQYTRKERIDPDGRRYGEQVLTGYIVSNQASVVVRDMEKVGDILDRVADAGGNLIRIQGIRFGIEDPTLLHTQAREAAVKDALAKARQFATLTGVGLGRLVFISETGATPVVRADMARMEMSLAAAPSTPISGGELSVQVTVQTVFAIQ